MNNNLGSTTSMPMPMHDDETALHLVFKWMDIDTVDLLLQTSKVCRSWKRASTTFLLENKASVYTDEGTIVTTRQEFLVEWQCEQRTYWAAYPPVGEDIRSSVRNLEMYFHATGQRIEFYKRFFSTYSERRCDWPEVLHMAGAPYIAVDNQSSLKSHLSGRSGDTFSEDEYRYFLRVSFGRHYRPEWFGLIALESVWRPGLSEGCILSKKRTRKLSKGSAIQLRFDVTSVPWRKICRFWRHDPSYGCRLPPFVGVIAVHKETREVSVLCTGFSQVDRKRPHGIGGVVPGEQVIVREVTRNAQHKAEKAELVVLVTKSVG